MGCVLFCDKIMPMIEKYWYEFSKIYARLMRLEYKMKRSAVQALVSYYEEKTLTVMLRFFQNKNRRKRYTKNEICAFDKIISNSSIENTGKFVALINLLYLSDLLMLILKTEQFNKPEILKDFYCKVPADMRDLEKNIFDLINLRNCIAHYNFSLYSKNKTKFLDTLYVFEVHLGHNVHGVEKLPKFDDEKPSIAIVLKAINECRPDLIESVLNEENDDGNYFNKHRILLSLFDDIAIYNGYETKDLPSPWGILRQMYNLKKELKAKSLI